MARLMRIRCSAAGGANDRAPSPAPAAVQQPVFLQLLAQGVAIDAQHLRRVGLVALRAQHHHFEDRLLDGKDDHVVDVRCLLLAQVVEILFKTLLDDFLDTFFAHFLVASPGGLMLSPLL
jgi:hypothetical protein